MRAVGSRRGNQGAVWNEVDSLLHERKTPSPTAAAADVDAIYERDRARASAVEELARLGPLPGQCGMAVSHGRWVTAIEIFGAPHLLGAHWAGLVRSHLLEPARPESYPSPTAVLSVIRRFATMKVSSAEGIGLGVERRGEDRRFTGQALTLDESFVHGTAFARRRDARQPG